MTEISNLINIAENIGMNQAAAQLKYIEERSRQTEASIIMPFVGEFSAGKTTLINALTDSKKLETSTKPTTATIFEIHFGQSKCDAEVFDSNGKSTHIDDIADLKNATLGEVPFVLVNDTSTKISSSTIIVDTPGLSSPEPKHKETLVKFLPKADGIILVVDVNQSITKSLTDFVKTMKMSKRPIFLVVSKCDSKSPAEVDAFKKYIAENCEIEISQVACVSVKNNDLEQLYSLFKNISTIKASILEKVNAQRVKNIAQSMVERIDDLLKAGNDDKELSQSIRDSEYELKKIKQNISNILRESETGIEAKAREAVRDFENTITPKLDAIAKASNTNFDQEAVSAVNTTSLLILNQFKQNVSMVLSEKVNSKRDTEDGINCQSLQRIDMREMSVAGLSYSLSLNEMGHEYDGLIKVGLGVAVAGAAIATGGFGLVGAAAEVGVTGTELAIEGAEIYGTYLAVKDEYGKPKMPVQTQPQPQVETRGIIDSVIGFVTDKTMGKPQRARAIRNYLDGELLPSFKNEMYRIKSELIHLIDVTLQNEAAQSIAEKAEALQLLKKQATEHKEQLKKRKEELGQYRTILSNI